MSQESIEKAAVAEAGESEEGTEGGKPMTFWEHLDELRKRLIWCIVSFGVGCAIAWEIRERMLAFLVQPFAQAWSAQHLPNAPTLHFGSPSAAFVAYFRLSMIGGGVLAAPFVFYQLWSFVAPGLYAREKRYLIPFVFLSSVLFVGGGYFGWRAAFPISFNYFLSMSGTVGQQSAAVTITPTVMMGEYIEFCSQMLLGFGLVFELPMLLLFLSIAGVVNHLHLIQYGRYFVLVAFVVAAIFTPPDMASQMAMAIPMCLLYTISIGLVFLFGKPPTEAQKKEFWEKRKKAREAKS